jgi:outer membrane protein TolC
MREVALLDRVAEEIVEAHTQVVQRKQRIPLSMVGITAAERSYELNVKRIENSQGLPIEVLQSIQALVTAQTSYLNAVIDYNTAQFQLCRATGWFVES